MSRLSQLITLARSLPPTPLRSAGAPQLSNALESIISRSFPSTDASVPPPPPSPSTSPAAPSSSSTTSSASSDISSVSTRKLGPSEEKAVEGMIRVLERLQSNTAMRDYPLSDRTLKPSHDPVYYKRIAEGVYRAQRGQARSWWRRFFQLRGEA